MNDHKTMFNSKLNKIWGGVLAGVLGAFAVVFMAFHAESAQVVTLTAKVDGTAANGGYSYGPDVPSAGHPEIRIALVAEETLPAGWVADDEGPKPWEWAIDVEDAARLFRPQPPRPSAKLAIFQTWNHSLQRTPGRWINGTLGEVEQKQGKGRFVPVNAQKTELVIPADAFAGKLGRWKIPAKVSHVGRMRNEVTQRREHYYVEKTVWVEFNVFTVETLGVYKADDVITDDYVMHQDTVGEIHDPKDMKKVDKHKDKFPFVVDVFAKTCGPTVQTHEIKLSDSHTPDPDKIKVGFFRKDDGSLKNVVVSKINGGWGGGALLNGDGEKGSDSVGDASIKAKVDGYRMTFLNSGKDNFPVTVFWFGGRHSLEVGGIYSLKINGNEAEYASFHGGEGDVAVRFNAEVFIRPAGADREAPQIAPWRQAFVQNVMKSSRHENYKYNSVVKWLDPNTHKTIIPKEMKRSLKFDGPVLDFLGGEFGKISVVDDLLYHQIDGRDTPSLKKVDVFLTKTWPLNGRDKIVKVQYKLSDVGITDSFKNWAAIFWDKNNSKMVVPVKEADWSVDSNSNANKSAVVGESKTATTAPVTGGVTANRRIAQWADEFVGEMEVQQK